MLELCFAAVFSSPFDHPQTLSQEIFFAMPLTASVGPEGCAFHRGAFRKSGGWLCSLVSGYLENLNCSCHMADFSPQPIIAILSSLLPSGFSIWEENITIHVHKHCRLSETLKLPPRTLSSIFSLLGWQLSGRPADTLARQSSCHGKKC